MPDSDSNTSDAPRSGSNLPVPVQQGEVLRPSSELWLMRALRSLFGWKAGSARADLQVVLDATTPDETSFTTVERTMLRNILGLHERRIADVMVPRGDIVSVKRDISLGELMSLFESAAHSRLVVYNDTLDDPEGFVHIRDLLAFVHGEGEGFRRGQRQAQETVSGGARSAIPSICACNSPTPISCAS